MDKNLTNLTIVGLQADHYKRLRAVRLKPTPHGLVPVRGKNGQGKSSLIDAICAAFEGKRASASDPIHHGKDRAQVIIDLGEIIVTRRWTDPSDPSKSDVFVESRGGARYKSPQKLLDDLTAKMANPVRLLNLPEKDQVREVLGMVELGFDLEASKREEAGLVERRKDQQREVKRLRGVVESLTTEVGDSPPRRVAVSELLEKMREARAYQEETEKLRAVSVKADIAHHEAVQELEQERGRIAELEAELDRAKQKAASLEGALDELQDAKDKAQAAFLDRVTPNIEALEQRLSQAESVNAAAGKAEELQAKREELERAEQAHAALEGQVEEVRTARTAKLGEASFPVAGMGYDVDNDRLTLDGVPFDQASQAQRLAASAALAMAQDAPIRVLYAREGSLLDDEHCAVLAEQVAAAGWQLWLERVDEEEEGPGVWIHDGEASGPMAAEGGDEQ